MDWDKNPYRIPGVFQVIDYRKKKKKKYNPEWKNKPNPSIHYYDPNSNNWKKGNTLSQFIKILLFVGIIFIGFVAGYLGWFPKNFNIEIPNLNFDSFKTKLAPDSAQIESLLFQRINQYRTENGVSPLQWNETLWTAATYHSADMGHRNFFDHYNPDGEDPTDRAFKLGYYSGVGENIMLVPIGSEVVGCGYVDSEESVASCAFNGWVNSSGHRQNMLNPIYYETGIGAVQKGLTFYITQDFG
ncbi:MAG: CAP domain-containing protein [Candidatus Gastranaerophilaceae bacterium]|jgi:uncharacterized protein YkwD